MRLTVKDMDIATGDIRIVIINQKDAQELDLHHMDRLVVSYKNKKTTAIVDIAESKKAVPSGKIGLFEEVLDALNAKQGDIVDIEIEEKPESLNHIKKKLEGKELTQKELNCLVKDIVENRLSDIELTSFVIASYAHGMTMKETAALTRAMAKTGDIIIFDKYPVVDIHSIGGVPGNRTTMIIVPILVAAGCIVPKTSSRAITSPSGTADTMEVLCPVSMDAKKLKKIINSVGGFIIWGGAVNLAPADDKIIQIEHPLSIDAEAQMLASIMAKKASVGPTHLLLEIPIGKGTKVKTKNEAKKLGKKFEQLGKELKIKTKTVITEASEPIGKGIGCVLEARDVLWALKSDEKAPKDLVEKSLKLSGIILEFAGKAKKGKGKMLAKQILLTGAAYGAMTKIVEAQGGIMPDPSTLQPAKETYTIYSNKDGKVRSISNETIAKTARMAGSPVDPDSGIYIHKHCGEIIKKGEPLLTIYARSKRKLEYAKKIFKKMDQVTIE